jgi:ADP-ribosyl-[dinitrogen reductase] hydrolase
VSAPSPPGRRGIEGRAVTAYLGLAVGDALGATVEFMTPREIRARFGTHDAIVGGGWLRLRRGQVTDDTTMTLALGRAILARGAVEARAAAEAFDAWMRARPVDIGNTVRRGIVHFRHTGCPHVPPSDDDAGNGACMRCLPVALATLGAASAAVRAASREQAHVTHHSALSDAATECVVAMVQRALLGAPLPVLLEDYVGPLRAAHPVFAFAGRSMDNPSGYIVDTLRAVLQSLSSTDSFESCVVDVVNRGGDADTTGAIAGMIAGALYGPGAIPRRWLAALEPAVRLECIRQAGALLQLSAVGSAAGTGSAASAASAPGASELSVATDMNAGS